MQMPELRNSRKGDSNQGSLDCESGILPLIYRAPKRTDTIPTEILRMIRWMCGVSLKERQPSTELRRRLGVEEIGMWWEDSESDWWHGHAERKADADYVKAFSRLVVEGKAHVGRPGKTWQSTLSADIRLLKVNPGNVHDRKKWRTIGRRKANPAASGTLH